MKVLFLCEGDAETAHGSFSGSAKSLVDHFRSGGHTVCTADVDLYGPGRLFGALASVARPRSRWGARYHLGAVPFFLRSRVAKRRLQAAATDVDCVVQIGATFGLAPYLKTPYFMYCDSNIRMAERGAATGQSQASALTKDEVERVAEREAAVYAGAAAVFAISDRLRQSFVDDFHLDPARVFAVYAGPNIDTASMLARPAAPASVRKPTILFVGARFLRKGGDLLLAAFRKVRAKIPIAELVIVGPRDLDLDEPGVTNLGFLRKDEPAEWARLEGAYREAGVFCLPTRYEPFGIVFLEAMFNALPCVGPDAWAVPEIVADGETGLLFPPDDVDALADRLIRLLEDPDRAFKMGAAGRERATRLFTWRAVVDRMTRVMESTIAAT